MGGDTVSLLRIEQIIEARLDARPFAKQSLDGHKLGDVAIALEGFSVAAPIETEGDADNRSEEHTSELQSLMRISYAVFCLKKKNYDKRNTELQSIRSINTYIFSMKHK